MDAKEIAERVSRLGKTVLKTDLFDAGSTMEQLAGWSSLRHVQLLAALEREFGVEFFPEEIPALRSHAALTAAIAVKRGA